jgi:uncharacterized BrkB/YihY/UPF0761 family membrane protein
MLGIVVRMRLGITLSIVFYIVCVGLLALLRSMDIVHGLTTPEMLYGPAITIGSSWIIFAIVYALLGRKKHDA